MPQSSLDSLPTSPDGVITYMGRSYDVKDLFPSLVTKEEDEEEVQVPGRRHRAPARRTKSAADPHSSLSPIRRPMNRCKSTSDDSSRPSRRITPTRTRSGGALTQMMQALHISDDKQHPQEATLPPPPTGRFPPPLSRNISRARSMGAVRGLFGAGEDADSYGIHSNSMRHLQFNQADVDGIVADPKEFERLKATLKKKGVVTNEVLKQRLHYYVKAKKDRDAGLVFPPAPKRRSRRGASGRLQRSRSDATAVEEQNVMEQPALMRRGTTGEFDFEPRMNH